MKGKIMNKFCTLDTSPVHFKMLTIATVIKALTALFALGVLIASVLE